MGTVEGRRSEGCLCGTGPGSKRLGIDDDREAVPLTLQIIYSKVSEVCAGFPSSPGLGPGAASSVLRSSRRPQTSLGTKRWPIKHPDPPKASGSGLKGLAMLPSRGPSVGEAAGVT